ncbi:FHA domain-containing protein [Undibacterium sp. SXout11W]|uniref:FHA domain-containing protein n=1 Tax=Undibacterium sp. SXout11W TaxID=3413050 RepID=UPI003BEF7C4B
MSNICPKGHFSTDTDYCSECGAPIKLSVANNNVPVAPKAADAKTASANAGNLDCPDCMTPRRSGARYCEVCRYDFELGASFNGLQSIATPAATPAATPVPQISPVVAAVTPAPAQKNVTLTPVASVELVRIESAVAAPTLPIVDKMNSVADPTVPSQRLKLIIMVDPTLYTENDPENPCPVGAPDKEYHLDLDEQTLGRQFEGKGIYPEIVVQDPGISRRHLKLMRDEKGNHTVLDLGSANGTELNQRPLDVGIVSIIRPGDQLCLGMWTRICVELR